MHNQEVGLIFTPEEAWEEAFDSTIVARSTSPLAAIVSADLPHSHRGGVLVRRWFL
jgi:hypothetical protein